MSIPMSPISLTGATAGQKATIPLNNLGIIADPSLIQKPGTLYFFNDSGAGLQISLDTSQSGFFLPAGAWKPVSIGPGEASFTYVVVYVLPNPPVSSLLVEYYAPGEAVPPTVTLGNSPIGGAVSSSNATSLTNTGFTVNTIFISASVVGDSPGTSNVTFYNNGKEVLGSQNYPGLLDLLNVSGNGDLNLSGNGEVKWTFSGVTEFDLAGSQVATLGQPYLIIRDTAGHSIFLSAHVQSISGTTGTATLLEYFYGNFRAVFVQLSNYTSAGAQTITLDNAFVGQSRVETGLIGTGGVMSFLKVGVAQNINVLTSLNAAGGGTTSQTTINQNSIGEIRSGWDTLQIAALVGSTSGTMEIRGI